MHDSVLKSKLLLLLLLAFKSEADHSSNNEKLLSGEDPIHCNASYNSCKINSARRHAWAEELHHLQLKLLEQSLEWCWLEPINTFLHHFQAQFRS